MKRRCVPRARDIPSFRAVSPESPVESRTTITSSPCSSWGTMLSSVRWIEDRPFVGMITENVAIGRSAAKRRAGRCPASRPLVAELGGERLAHACDDGRLLVGELPQPGIREERVPLAVAGQGREREAVAGAGG